jgi:hypothetical protein
MWVGIYVSQMKMKGPNLQILFLILIEKRNTNQQNKNKIKKIFGWYGCGITLKRLVRRTTPNKQNKNEGANIAFVVACGWWVACNTTTT